MSEYISEDKIQRFVAGREGGKSLIVTMMDDEVQFAIKDPLNPQSHSVVSLSTHGFEVLLNKLLTAETGAERWPPQRSIKPHSLPRVPIGKLPENIDDLPQNAKNFENRGGLRKPWTQEDDLELSELMSAGRTDREISEITGRSESAIGNRKLHIRRKKKHAAASKKKPANQSGNLKNPAWSEDEDAELSRRVLLGQGNIEISRAIGRSEISVRDRKRHPKIREMIAPKIKEMVANAEKHLDFLAPAPEADNGEEG